MERNQTDIVIAGGGVAGLTAAAAFGQAGFSVTLLDPFPPITDARNAGADLRTTAFLQPARSFLERTGIWENLAQFATPLKTMRIVDAGQSPVVTRDFHAADISDAPFGWNLPNWLLRRELTATLAHTDTVDFRTGTGFTSMVTRLATNIVTLGDGTQLDAKLVIGADGRNSAVRQAAEIDVETTRYGQKAIVFAVTHDAPHDNISTEIHRKGGPFTLVPLPDFEGRACSSVVWMASGQDVAALAALDDASFAIAATDRSAHQYGRLTLVGRRSVWPIVSQMSDRLTATRTALVAEAAHVMPPIGAQGLNMSLADLECLLDLSITHRADLGCNTMLDAYQKARHRDIALRVRGVDALNRASMTGSPLMHDLRSLGIKMLHDIAPVRKRLMALGLGATR